MAPYRLLSLLILLVYLLVASLATAAADLSEIQARGELRHLGIRYVNFVTGAGDGFDAELIQGFAKFLDVDYKLVYSDFYSVFRDLLGKNVVRAGDSVTLEGDFPIKGDMIATGFTVLPWREQVLLYFEPTFPSQVMLIARADSPIQPIQGSEDLLQDNQETKALIGAQSLLIMEKTCLDPANYGMKGQGIELCAYTKSSNINEMVPALLNLDADLPLLDIPDLMLDMQKWAGSFKVIGPISSPPISFIQRVQSRARVARVQRTAGVFSVPVETRRDRSGRACERSSGQDRSVQPPFVPAASVIPRHRDARCRCTNALPGSRSAPNGRRGPGNAIGCLPARSRAC